MSGPYHAKVTLREGMHFVGVTSDPDADRFVVNMDSDAETGGQGKGMRPNKLVLISLAGCMAMDVVSILRKKKQNVTGLEVGVISEDAPDYPMVYTDIQLMFTITGKSVEKAAVERALQLSFDKYCPVANLLKPVVPITMQYEIIES
jgi:putative redox protein